MMSWWLLSLFSQKFAASFQSLSSAAAANGLFVPGNGGSQLL
jgi:hypothetical protein